MSFEKAFTTLQTNTDQIWKYFDRYDGQTLNLSPAPGKWSALQHLVHINKANSFLPFFFTAFLGASFSKLISILE